MAKTGPHSPRYDWEAIELDYKAGVIPLEGLHLKHGVSIIRLLTVAQQKGWQRAAPPTAIEVHGLASSGFPATAARHESFNMGDLKKAALMTAASVVQTHRSDITKLRANAALLIERLGLLLEGKMALARNPDGSAMTDGDGKDIYLPCLGGRESPADLLEKLSRVMTRTVQLERQSYGLDSMPQNPDGSASGAEEATVAAVVKEMEDLKVSINELTNQKAKIAKAEKVK